jgi:glycosyltransferase involved in cell wall biosynthesis
MADPRVSVCIPTYNRARYLRAAISGALDQDVSSFELLVSDDGSTDATPDVVRSFASAKIRYTRNPQNLGLWGNTNQCLAQARGEYVIVLQDDDVMLPGLLRRETEVLDHDPSVVLVHAAVRQVDQDSQTLGEPPQSWPSVTAGLEFVTDYWSGPRYGVVMSSAMFRRAVSLKLGGFKAGLLFSADADLWQRMAFEGRVAFLNQPMVLSRVHSGQVTTRILLDGGHMLRERLEHAEATRRLLAEQGANLDGVISRRLSQYIASDLTTLRGFGVPLPRVLRYCVTGMRLHPPALRSAAFHRNLILAVLPPALIRWLRQARSRWWQSNRAANRTPDSKGTNEETAS